MGDCENRGLRVHCDSFANFRMGDFSMCCNLRRAVFSLTILGLLVPTTVTMAGSLLPNPANGNPHSVGPVNNFTVSLIPDPAQYRSEALGCPWLVPAAQAAAQGFSNATNIWTFGYAAAGTFNGTFTLTTYAATNNGTNGGANFDITYTPGMGDPAGGDVRWTQVIDETTPLAPPPPAGSPGNLVAGTGVNGIPLGTSAYLDDAGPGVAGTPVDPYYGWLTSNGVDITTSTAANSTHFLDTPFLGLANGRTLEFQVFLSTEKDTVAMDPITMMNVTTHSVTFYGGVWYGFQDVAVPEPSSFILFASAFGFIALVRRRNLLRCFGFAR